MTKFSLSAKIPNALIPGRRHIPFASFAIIAAISAFGFTPAVASAASSDEATVAVSNPGGWASFLTVDQLQQISENPDTLIVDARSPEEYAEGHIPGAINVPHTHWRSPRAPNGQGPSQEIFRTADGSPDVSRYEQLLGSYGILPEHHVVMYGGHGGRNDGTTPAVILNLLGHSRVSFLDGVGLDEWKNAGLPVSTEARTLEPGVYTAQPKEGIVWNLQDVLANLENPNVVFLDVRSPEEYSGEDVSGNARAGHIPGAVNIDYTELLKGDKTSKSLNEVKELLVSHGITPDKTVVLYCQTATRTSLPELALKDLGYNMVAVYDASWQEYGNREDTPIATP